MKPKKDYHVELMENMTKMPCMWAVHKGWGYFFSGKQKNVEWWY